MSDTPRVDAIKLSPKGAAGLMQDLYDIARQLERENARLRDGLIAWSIPTGDNAEFRYDALKLAKELSRK